LAAGGLPVGTAGEQGDVAALDVGLLGDVGQYVVPAVAVDEDEFLDPERARDARMSVIRR
jgi:hypothetical protein